MVAKNDITGDLIQSRQSSKEYQENLSKIFGDKDIERERKAKEKAEYFAKLNAETLEKMNESPTKLEDGFDLESLDPAERSWYYDDHGIRRKKKEDVKIKATLPKIKIKGSTN